MNNILNCDHFFSIFWANKYSICEHVHPLIVYIYIYALTTTKNTKSALNLLSIWFWFSLLMYNAFSVDSVTAGLKGVKFNSSTTGTVADRISTTSPRCFMSKQDVPTVKNHRHNLCWAMSFVHKLYINALFSKEKNVQNEQCGYSFMQIKLCIILSHFCLIIGKTQCNKKQYKS